MSNSLAIAVVTVSLKNLLSAAVSASPDSIPGPTVTTLRPGATGIPTVGINVFLYQVTTNPSIRNEDLPVRRGDGSAATRPAVALDLRYLLTFHGDESQWLPQRLLTIAVSTLHAQPTLSEELIDAAVANELVLDPSLTFLEQADLSRSGDRVRLTLESPSTEELSKVWGGFPSVPQSLSLCYRASFVRVESGPDVPRALPVLIRNIYALPTGIPRLELIGVAPTVGVVDPRIPVRAESRIRLLGSELSSDGLRVLLDDTEITPALDLVRERQVDVDLPGTLLAGVHWARVMRGAVIGTPAIPHRGFESNALPFVLVPDVLDVDTSDVSTSTVSGVEVNDATTTLTVEPPVGRDQDVVLLLSRLDASPAPRPDVHQVALPLRGPGDPATSATAEFTVTAIRSGTYIVRIRIDGSENVPMPGESWPTVVLP